MICNQYEMLCAIPRTYSNKPVYIYIYIYIINQYIYIYIYIYWSLKSGDSDSSTFEKHSDSTLKHTTLTPDSATLV